MDEDFKNRQIDKILLSIENYKTKIISLYDLINTIEVLLGYLDQDDDNALISEMKDYVNQLELISSMQKYEERESLNESEEISVNEILKIIEEEIHNIQFNDKYD